MRPSEYSPEIAERICERLIEGETLTVICAEEGMPAKSTFFRWVNTYDELRNQYARARELQADTYADLILNVAFDKQGDTTTDEYGNEKPNHEYINRSRLKVDALKWHASKLAPKKYGDKIEQTIQGGDPNKPIKVDLSTATQEQVMDFIRKKTHENA